jgi:hypothetical protein
MAEKENVRAYVLIPSTDTITDELIEYFRESEEVYWYSEVEEEYSIVAGVIVGDDDALRDLVKMIDKLTGANSASALVITRYVRLRGHDNGP